MAELCQAYWYPLYVFARRETPDAETAADRVQGFFTYWLEHRALRGADPAKGRFRSYLLAAFRHFCQHQRDRERALKRGGGEPTLSLDAEAAERRFVSEAVAPDLDPEQAYERRFALTVLDRSLEALAAEAKGNDKLPLFEALKGQLVGGGRRGELQRLAEDLDMTPGALRVAMHRLRQRFAAVLRQEVAHTVDSQQQVDEELRYLLTVLSRDGSAADGPEQ